MKKYSLASIDIFDKIGLRSSVRIFFLFFLLLQAAKPGIAAESPLNAVLESSKSLVDVLSVNVSIVSDTPQGLVDPKTGQVFVATRMAPVSYTRNGSGIVIDPRGIIVTNAHIVQGAGALIVTFLDGRKASVKEICFVRDVDLAFLIFDPPSPLNFVRLANSDAAVAGMDVYTVGHSEWLNGTVMGGRILGTQIAHDGGAARIVGLILNFDMAQGDSGCPVFNSRGELLGIIGASLSGRPNATLAIPSNGITIAYREYLKRLGAP